MLWIATPELAAAISNAGALGNLTSGNYDSAEDLAAAIDKTRKLTSRPFIVNITTMPSIRLPTDLLQDFFQICCEKKVTAIEIAGAPVDTFLGRDFLPMAKDADVKVVHKVGTVKHAVHAQRIGYDAVIIAGFEEGGFPHKDNVSTMVLVPKAREAVSIPVMGGRHGGRQKPCRSPCIRRGRHHDGHAVPGHKRQRGSFRYLRGVTQKDRGRHGIAAQNPAGRFRAPGKSA
ncbi:MAG: nitronate monooxygenase, partial [Deltaproteobacteria bacterium]|nr:nitronate monooxygenase [Deltaproteobacteria bacterium]